MVDMFKKLKVSKADYLLILLPLVLLVFGQVMSKFGANHQPFLNMFVLFGYLALLMRGIIWVFVLRKLPVSLAYPVLSLSYIFILALSAWFFGEEITTNRVIGSILIIAGVILTSIYEMAGE